MAPTKRARPTFSPPRPRKAANTSTSKTSTKSKPVGRPRTSGGASISKTSAATKSKSKAPEKTKRRSRLVSPTPSASDSQGNESAEEDEDDGSADENDDEDAEEGNTTLTAHNNSSPEPDYILAEVTHSPTSSSTTPPIPLGLIHRILHSQFADPEKTKISTDAREVVGKYIEVFVREAIMRCAYAKNGGDGGGEGGAWLEVEDLEKVAVQLCLDF